MRGGAAANETSHSLPPAASLLAAHPIKPVAKGEIKSRVSVLYLAFFSFICDLKLI